MKRVKKVYAYITWEDRLLVFTQPNAPEAGLQVPGGTVEVGEAVETAVLREAFEETGLPSLQLISYLGKQTFDLVAYGREEIVSRYFFHLRCTQTPPERWQHVERFASEGVANPVFELFWLPLNTSLPPLVAALDAFIPQLLARFDSGGKA